MNPTSNKKKRVFSLWVVLTGVGGLVGLVGLLYFCQVLRNFNQFQTTGNDKDKNRFDASVAFTNTIVGGIGTIATVAGGVVLYLNFREATENTKIAEDRLITERFSKAVEQLGSNKLEIRLGGIYSLERIAKDSPDDHGTVMEVLASFIRRKSPIPVVLDQEKQIAIDIQAVLTVIGRRNSGNDKEYTINLRKADLTNADLRKAILCGTDLGGGFLFGADLNGAILHNGKLFNANLYWANLRKANLSEADLSGAILHHANLSQTFLFYKTLTGGALEKKIEETLYMIRSVKNWELATYDDYWRTKLELPEKT